MDMAGRLSAVADNGVRLGTTHGYRFDRDWVELNAELSVLHDAQASAQQWALQLWACETPYAGGSLRGIKVAETPVELAAEPVRLEAALPARLPVGPRDYSMVLVLASGSEGQFDQVHDFANYPARERFAVPHFDGSAGYRIEGGEQVILTVARVCNPRDEDNLSGSLALELWALEQPYTGGAAHGVRLAACELPRIAGQSALESSEYRLPFSPPPPGSYTLSLMLREWTAVGYDTRDYCNFATPYAASAAPVAAAEPDVLTPALPLDVGGEQVATAGSADGRVSIQDASEADLLAVQGLNKRLVAEILRARPFTTFEQLLRVRGVGAKRLSQLRAKLKL